MNEETRKAMAHIHGNYPRMPGETDEDVAAREAITGVKVPDRLREMYSMSPTWEETKMRYKAPASFTHISTDPLAMRTINQPSMPSQAMMEMLAVQKQADALIRQTCGISDPGHSHSPLRDAGYTHPVGDDPFSGLQSTVFSRPPTGDMAGDGADTFASRRAAFLQERGFTGRGECDFKALSAAMVEFGAQQATSVFREEYSDQWKAPNARGEIRGISQKARIIELEAENNLLQTKIAMLRAHPPLKQAPDGLVHRWSADDGCWVATLPPDEPADTGPKADYHGPDDAAHRAVHNVAEHLLGGRVTDAKARRGLRDALDKADRPATGKAASDQAIGRATRMQETVKIDEPHPSRGYRYDPTTNRTYGVPVCGGFGRPDPVQPPAAAAPPSKPPLPGRALQFGGSSQIGLRLP